MTRENTMTFLVGHFRLNLSRQSTIYIHFEKNTENWDETEQNNMDKVSDQVDAHMHVVVDYLHMKHNDQAQILFKYL
jgi:uncharacterized phage-like protein YoqJ